MPFYTTANMTTIRGGKWKMEEELDYVANDGTFIRVPRGFVHDLASIPRPLNLLFRVNGDHREAAILHDYAYANLGKVSSLKPLTRQECDLLFLEAMHSMLVNRATASSMYYAVRWFGWFAWNAHKNKNNSAAN